MKMRFLVLARISSQSASRICGHSVQTTPLLRLESLLHLPGICADVLADPGNFVHERDRTCEERVDRMFDHFRGLGPNDDQVLSKIGKKRFEFFSVRLCPHTENDAICIRENRQRLAQAQIFWRISESMFRETRLKCATSSRRNLRRNQD